MSVVALFAASDVAGATRLICGRLKGVPFSETESYRLFFALSIHFLWKMLRDGFDRQCAH